MIKLKIRSKATATENFTFQQHDFQNPVQLIGVEKLLDTIGGVGLRNAA